MNTPNGPFLSTIDRITSKIGPLNLLVGMVVDKIAPKATAKACHTGTYCYSSRGAWCHWYCNTNRKRVDVYHEIQHFGPGCAQTCDDGCDYSEVSVTNCAPC